MSRGQGRLYRQPGSAVWWLDYSVRGKRHRESSGSTRRSDAADMLRQRIGDRRAGKLTGSPDKVMFVERDPRGELLGGLRALVERQYVLDGRRSLDRVRLALQHLEGRFGTWRALDITPEDLDRYAEQRMAEGASRATVNYELAALRRGFRLAAKKGLLATAPIFDLPKLANARSGFFAPADMAALMAELSVELRPLIEFLHVTGWRRDEGRLLTWPQIDRDGETIRLTETKSGEPRVFPYGKAPPLKALIEARWDARDGLSVFHVAGEPIGIGKLRLGWNRACKRAGLEGRLVHDLRRSAARDMRRAGMSESDIMELCGWETREMFKRYCIKDEAALADAVAKRFGSGIERAESEPAAAPGDALSSDPTT